jgi:hypothetical protein
MNDEDTNIEAVLGRYRPLGPPAGLRDRVVGSSRPRRSRLAVAAWLSMAAALVLSVGLHLATERVMRQTAATLKTPQTQWTPEAEEAAELLNGQGSGRRYIAFALAAHKPKTERLSRQSVPSGLLKNIQ